VAQHGDSHLRAGLRFSRGWDGDSAGAGLGPLADHLREALLGEGLARSVHRGYNLA
jgi:hypothetical protein